MTQQSWITKPEEYIRGLVESYIFFQEEEDEDFSFSVSQASFYLKCKILPVMREWNKMDFLPSPEWLMLFCYVGDSCYTTLSSSGELALYKNLVMQLCLENRTLISLLNEVHQEKGLSPSVVGRALFLTCPLGDLSRSYQGPVSSFIRNFPDFLENFLLYFNSQYMAKVHMAGIDFSWIKEQLSLQTKEKALSLLNSPLRPRDIEQEKSFLKIKKKLEENFSSTNLLEEKFFQKYLKENSKSELFLNIYKKLRPLFQSPSFTFSKDSFGGGYQDISTQGKLQHLILSQLAYPEEEFWRRLSAKELLFYEPERLTQRANSEQWVFLDNSALTWGITRKASLAFSLAIWRQAKQEGAEVCLFGGGKLDKPFTSLDSPRELKRFLNFQRWRVNWERELPQLLSKAKEQIEKSLSLHLYICTEEGYREKIFQIIEKAPLPSELKLYLFTCNLANGKTELWKRERPWKKLFQIILLP